MPILYGYPSPSAIDDARHEKVVLGGCIVDDDAPDRACPGCDHRFRSDG